MEADDGLTYEELVKASLWDVPQYLVDMRMAYRGKGVLTEAQQRLKRFCERNQTAFIREWRAAEKEWRQMLPKEKADAQPALPEESLKDERHGKLKELIEECREGLREARSERLPGRSGTGREGPG